MNVKYDSVVTLSDRLERLSAYDVEPEAFELSPRTFIVRPDETADSPEKPDRASIVGDGILAFVSGMSEQNQADIQHSYLFASLVANKRYPRDEQGKEWYQLFLQVMQDCGWTILQKYYDAVAASGKSFKMDQLVLKILGSAVTAAAVPGPSSLLMLKVASDAIAALQSRDRPLRVFDQNIQESGTGGFGVAACHETPQGEVIMALGAVRFIKRTNQTQVLFVNWDSSSVDLYRGESHMTMVPSVINRTRATIIEKLGDRAQKKIEAYEL
ncbi:hypothetical protein SAMN03159443_04941 [Pseudomonas sp. NFACC15-1]|uniref:hypothetical protein n=1 Tax=unclassified Pseudomonas TaxID=196821 RepID=UPI00087FD965|nr:MULTISPECIES: hypothetical protein [unclassified Pseudomonas]SDA93062.1 hypothetical protein SAMN03159443_04941 [Pseudomonas sp. NFACC15-1]SDY61247.1 hypothetical protein SAMN03159380_04393 [Pseudomonas sp. NFACC14]